MNLHLFLLLNFMFLNHQQHLLWVNLNMGCRWIILVVKRWHPRILIPLWVFLVRPTLAEQMRLFSTHHQNPPGTQCHISVLSPTRCSTDTCSVGKTGRDRSDRTGQPIPNQCDVSTSTQPNSSSNFDKALADYNNDSANLLKESFGVDVRSKTRTYQKPYPTSFDSVAYPAGFRLSEFVKFSGEDTRSTFEHISQYLAQLGEASSIKG